MEDGYHFAAAHILCSANLSHMVPVSRNTKLESNLLADLGYQPVAALSVHPLMAVEAERCLVVGDCGKTKVFSVTEGEDGDEDEAEMEPVNREDA